MATKIRISKSLNDLLTKRAGRLASKAMANPKLANRIKNKLLLFIKKNGIKPDLKASTVASRKRLARVNKTSRFYSEGKSNLTFTGNFLNSFKARIIEKISKIGNASVIFSTFPTGTHKAYKLIRKGKTKTIDNEILGQHLIDGGRDYTKISSEQKKAITKSIKSAILKEFKLNLKR